jgi:hypothetical protein
MADASGTRRFQCRVAPNALDSLKRRLPNRNQPIPILYRRNPGCTRPGIPCRSAVANRKRHPPTSGALRCAGPSLGSAHWPQSRPQCRAIPDTGNAAASGDPWRPHPKMHGMAADATGRHRPGAMLAALVLRSPLHQSRARFVSGLLGSEGHWRHISAPVSVIRGRGAWP